MANITRDSFNETKAVSRKIFQKGSHLTDADLNEQFDILQTVDRRTLSALTNHTNWRIGDGFKVVGTGLSLQVVIKAGRAVFQIGTQSSVLLNLDQDYTLAGFSSFSTLRTDYVYIDITESEITPTEDPNIVIPQLGQMTCVDHRIAYSFAISEAGFPGAAPTGHTYIVIGSVSSADNTLASSEVSASILDLHTPIYPEIGSQNLLRNGGFEIWNNGVRPDGWTLTSPMNATTRKTSDGSLAAREGQYFVQCGFSAGGGSIERDAEDYVRFKGKTIVAMIHAGTMDWTGRFARLVIDDGQNLTTGNWSVFGSTWTKLTVAHTVSNNANKLTFKVETTGGASTDKLDLSEAAIFIGENPRNFEQHPRDAAELFCAPIEIPIYAVRSQGFNDTTAPALSDATCAFMVDGGATSISRVIVRIPYFACPAYKSLVLRCKAWVEAGGNGFVRLRIPSNFDADIAVTENTSTLKELVYNLSQASLSGTYELQIMAGSGANDVKIFVENLLVTVRLSGAPTT